MKLINIGSGWAGLPARPATVSGCSADRITWSESMMSTARVLRP